MEAAATVEPAGPCGRQLGPKVPGKPISHNDPDRPGLAGQHPALDDLPVSGGSHLHFEGNLLPAPQLGDEYELLGVGSRRPDLALHSDVLEGSLKGPSGFRIHVHEVIGRPD